MASFNAATKRPNEEEAMNVSPTARHRTLPPATTFASESKDRRDYSLPAITNAQLSLLEVAINSSDALQGLPDVILDLVGGRVPPKVPTTLPTDSSKALTSKDQLVGNAFVDAFKRQADIQTNKGGAAFESTGSALVDLDFALKPPGDVDEIRGLLEAAYKEDALATVKIVFKARSIHEGKGFREGLWIAAGWLMEHHPVTLLENLHLLVDPTCECHRSKARDDNRPKSADNNANDDMGVETLDEAGNIEANVAQLPEYPARPHGTWDDLNDLVMLALNGQLNATYTGHPTAPEEVAAPSKIHRAFEQERKARRENKGKRDRRAFKQLGVQAKMVTKGSFEWELLKAGSKKAKGDLYAKRLVDALTTDQKFQALYLTVVYLFVRQLKADIDLSAQHEHFLSRPAEQRQPFGKNISPHLFAMSFAAKWAASPGHSADKQTYLASAIGHLLFPGEGFNVARTRLQQVYLAKLRKMLSVPEVAMKQGEWKIDYNKVPGRCMARNANNFMAHDPVGFERYLTKVASGRSSISGATLLPHEILMDACGDNKIAARVADLQWRSLVDSIKSAGSKLDNCVAVADVSGSMGSYLSGDKKHPQPINVCIALTLLLGEVASDPWRGMFFTFSSTPSAEFVDMNQSLRERATTLAQARWGMTTNFHTVFELILQKAQQEQLDPKDMVRKLFVFSDMQFDAAAGKHQGDTEYAGVRRKFEQAGYTMPELIFWNLYAGDKTPVPVEGDQEGVSLMSGFSAAQIKYFLRAQGEGEEEGEATRKEEEVVADMVVDKAEADEEEVKVTKKQDSPFDTLRKSLDAVCFNGVKIYD